MNFLITFLFISYCYSTNILDRCVNDNTILFTFDDVPDNTKNIERIRVILNRYNVKGLFFVNGFYIQKYNKYNLIKQLSIEGHIIGTHTYSHPSMSQLNDFTLLRELYDNELIIRNLINKRPVYFRPPYFDYSDDILNKIADFNYTLLTANLNPQDWSLNDENLIFNYYTQFFNTTNENSFISLMHSQIRPSVNILEKLIIYIKTKTNFSIVSPSECFNINDYTYDYSYGPNLI